MIVPGTSNEINAFSVTVNVDSDGEAVTSDGKSFHIRAPVTGKARRPTVESLTAGTNRLRTGVCAVKIS